MDEKKLQDMLSKLQGPEPPDEAAKKRALNKALLAFDEKIQQKIQGVSQADRLMNVDTTFSIRRMIMQKKYIWSGVVGAVAATALVVVIGTPYFKNKWPEERYRLAAPIVSSNDASFLEARRIKQLDIVSEQNAIAVDTEMHKRVEEALKQPGQAFPAPVAKPAPAPADRDITLGRSRQDRPKEVMQEPPAIGRAAAPPALRTLNVAPPTAPSVSSKIEYYTPNFSGFQAGVADPSYVMAGGKADQYQPQYYKDQGRDKFQTFKENTVKSVVAEPVSTFSIDVDTASYSFMRRELNNGVLPQKDAVRIEEMVNYFDYNYALPESRKEPFKPTVAVYDVPWNPTHKMIHVGIKGYDIPNKPKSNLVFLIDTSGSMDSPDKLPLLVNSFKMMLDSLSPDDTVGIVTYAGSAGTVLEPTKAGDKQKIIEALNRLQSGGSTAGAEGIRQAYALAEQAFIKEGNNRVILATDGDFNVGITNPDELKGFVERKRGEGIYLSVLGFGEGNYNDQMMQTLAQNGNGNAAYIDSLNEARKVLVQEAGSTLFTIAKDVKIQMEFNPAMVSEYRLIGYETRHLNREDFNNDKVDAGEVGAGHAVTALYEITPVGAPKVVDDLRYGVDAAKKVGAVPPNTGEYAFLKIRYKQPDSDTSTLMTQPITPKDNVTFGEASDDVRFAAAVAGFGELLKGSKYTGSLTYDRVIDMANSARGKDDFGYRTEFVNLVRLAKSAAGLQTQKE